MSVSRTFNILAAVYSDGFAADRLLADIAYRLRDDGVAVAGLVQINTEVAGRTKCDMAIEELYSRKVIKMSEDRGPAARGCRLDHTRLIEAGVLLNAALAHELSLIVLNKFGKVEAEGGGLRDVMAHAVALEIPMMVGVPYRNLDQWRLFTGGMADECEIDATHVLRWLAARGICGAAEARTQRSGEELRA